MQDLLAIAFFDIPVGAVAGGDNKECGSPKKAWRQNSGVRPAPANFKDFRPTKK
jgi:hypothetical protein